MADARTYYDHDHYKQLSQWFIRERIGLGLRERYQVPKDLPPELLAPVRKLIAIEGDYRLRIALDDLQLRYALEDLFSWLK
jgi:hypothetical protein